IYFLHENNFTIECSLTNGIDTSDTPEPHGCSNYINKTIYDASSPSRPYAGAFLPDYNVTPSTGAAMIDLEIFIMDPAYNKYDPNLRDPSTFTPFDLSLAGKNAYYLSQPKSDIIVYFWRFTRTIRYNIIPDFLSYFGRPRYSQQPYIESNIRKDSYIRIFHNYNKNFDLP
ncbi:14355_t:CDS:2, partial [Racocetra persica]